MVIPERWARAFVGAAGADGSAAGEGLAFLRAVLPLLRRIGGRVAGRASAVQLEVMLRVAAAEAGGPSPGAEWAIRLLVLLVKKNGLPHGGAVAGAIAKIIDQQRGVLEVGLESALPPEGEFQESLKKALIKKTGAREIRIVPRIRPELLAGFRLRLGDEALDASLRGLLERMAADLKAAPLAWGDGGGAAGGT